MNSATQLASSTMLAATGGSTPGTSLDVGSSQELYAIWKSVFERAKPVHISHEAAHSSAHAYARQGDFLVGVHDHSALPTDAAQAKLGNVPPASRTDIAPGQYPGAASPTVGTSAGPTMDARPEVAAATSQWASRLDSSARTANVIHSELQSAVAGGHSTAPGKEVSTQSGPAQLPSADSVNVFVRGADVAIVVRDAGISEQQALHCAFETARKLTGQRAALQQLVLNGRTLYQQPGDSRMHDSARSSSLVFAC